MTAYQADRWHELFVMVGGAAAALAGMLFVAVSINLDEVLANRALPPTVARSLAVLLGQVAAAVVVLIPAQTIARLDFELTLLGGLVLVGSVTSVVRGHVLPRLRWQWTFPAMLIALSSTLPMLIAGLSCIASRGGGLNWLVAEIILGLAAATYNRWIIRIEIRR